MDLLIGFGIYTFGTIILGYLLGYRIGRQLTGKEFEKYVSLYHNQKCVCGKPLGHREVCAPEKK
jgi:hypothetical protein